VPLYPVLVRRHDLDPGRLFSHAVRVVFFCQCAPPFALPMRRELRLADSRAIRRVCPETSGASQSFRSMRRIEARRKKPVRCDCAFRVDRESIRWGLALSSHPCRFHPPHQIVRKARKRLFEGLAACTVGAPSAARVCPMGPTAIVLETTTIPRSPGYGTNSARPCCRISPRTGEWPC
jgi:hypothetical protein